MAFPQFVTDAAVLADLAAALKLWDDTVSPNVVAPPEAPYWTQIVALQHQRAANEIYSRLAEKGYDPVSQIPGWDRGPEWERNLALLYTLEAGGATTAVDPALLRALRGAYATDPAKATGLYSVLLTVGGVPQYPTDAPGTVGHGGVDTHAERHWDPDSHGIRF